MRSISDLIDVLGPVPDLARSLGEKPATVHKWRQRQSIPLTYWPAMIAAAKGRDMELTADQLLSLSVKAHEQV